MTTTAAAATAARSSTQQQQQRQQRQQQPAASSNNSNKRQQQRSNKPTQNKQLHKHTESSHDNITHHITTCHVMNLFGKMTIVSSCIHHHKHGENLGNNVILADVVNGPRELHNAKILCNGNPVVLWRLAERQGKQKATIMDANGHTHTHTRAKEPLPLQSLNQKATHTHA